MPEGGFTKATVLISADNDPEPTPFTAHTS